MDTWFVRQKEVGEKASKIDAKSCRRAGLGGLRATFQDISILSAGDDAGRPRGIAGVAASICFAVTCV